jgi:hypothetical protein
MRNHWTSSIASTALLLIGCCASLAAQAADDIGVRYQLPPDWIVVAPKPQQQPVLPAASLVPKRGIACISISQTARRGDPASVIVVVELPFDCYGQSMAEQDLPGFGSGVADGLKQTFDIAGPVLGTYTLGSHSFWIERAKGTPKGRSDAQNGAQYTVEIACSVLKLGAVCWMTTAADEASLHAFEAMPVALDGEPSAPLAPPTAFDKAPAAP